MKWTSALAIAFLPAFLGTACSHHESQAAPPKTASRLPPQDHPMPASANPATPPAPDANAATRKPAEPMSKAPPPEVPPAEASRDAQAGSGDEHLLSDEEAAIPTQEEANREAEQAINDENADQEFDKLEKELGGGGG